MAKQKWTDEELIEIAHNFTVLHDFRKAHDAEYQAIRKRNLPAVDHMQRHHTEWTKEKLIAEAQKYSSRVELRNANKNAYKAIMYHKLQEEAYAHIPIPNHIKWTKEALRKEITKYGSRSEFRKNNINAYDAVKRRRWVSELLGQFPDWRQEKRIEKIVPIDNGLIGIYILYNLNDIVYVGKTKHCFYDRLLKHMSPGSKEYKELTSIELYEINSHADIDVAELYLINKYKPLLNLDSNSNDELTLTIDNLDEIIEATHKFEVKDNKCIPLK